MRSWDEAIRRLHTLLDGTEFLLKIDVERGSSHLFLVSAVLSMLMMTPRVIRWAACRGYFRIVEILKHWSRVGKQMGKGGQWECVAVKRKN